MKKTNDEVTEAEPTEAKGNLAKFIAKNVADELLAKALLAKLSSDLDIINQGATTFCDTTMKGCSKRRPEVL